MKQKYPIYQETCVVCGNDFDYTDDPGELNECPHCKGKKA